ncbi:UvrD-helicase domain-containing protein [Maribellus sediminis]|uniref:UvrD-helicase domain-containing protein n=1 Tax=Maribellus sediminis TaxID=2696285 RepID=UPI00142F74BC|nr:UvrD-helicase domain-containing protein [Maribellus sediminis]
MLTVYKASAGSGKTFRLVVEYLKLILENPFNYRHILAVTFTNKATNEMKSRILEQLNFIAIGKDSATIQQIQKETDYSEQFIRSRAQQVLKNILHDYNRFSINTIDSFTQKVIKSFNRELGISPNFTLELDTDMILEEAVQRLFSKIGEDKNLLDWLREYSRERIEENFSQQLDIEIKKLGTELFKERFQEFFPENGETVYTRENLENFVKDVQKLKTSFEATLKNKGKEVISAITKNELSFSDFSYGINGIGGFFQHLSEGNFYDSKDNYRLKSSRIISCKYDTSKWVSKKHKREQEIKKLIENELIGSLENIFEWSASEFPRYNTALAVLKQIRTLGILIDLKEEIKDLLHEKGILPLSDSNLLLSKIIGQSDSPFVYEKIGNYYHHFMLDEFQDTSGLQWQNFRPLVINSLAEGNDNLIVGDVKQSIYRWRNSDWNILAEKLYTEFTSDQLKDETLKFNFRSDRNIIEFNNTIIEAFVAEFENRLFSEIGESESHLQRFKTIYNEHLQQPGNPDAPQNGFIQANFLEPEDFEELTTQKLVEQVKLLQDQGISAEEIAILIRKNSEGTKIIEAFLNAAKLPGNKNYNLSVLSNESLFLNASKGVLFIVHMLEFLVDPDDKIAKATLLFMWQSWLKPQLQTKGIVLNKAEAQQPSLFDQPETWKLRKDFEAEFELELGELLENIRSKVLLASLDEAVTQIASQTGIFRLEAELPFVQTLMDKAGELKSSLSNDLSNLLLWWNEKGYKTSVNVNEEVSSIRLLTVHKSKGLEYKAVLLPFFNWNTEPGANQMPILWCEPQSSPFNQFPLLPIQSGNTIKESEFAPIYFEEKVNNYIDTLNLVYVAFTRAKSVLIVNSPQPKLKKDGTESESTSMDYLFYSALRNSVITQKYGKGLDSETKTFEFGSFKAESKKADENQTLLIGKYAFNDFSDRIKLRLSGEDFLLEGDKQRSEKNIGKIIHEILSAIETSQDVAPACLQALKAGKINDEEYRTIEQSISKNLQLDTVKSWFDGSFEVLNEHDLLSNSTLLRPDRIMISGDSAVVVDYKTGEKIPTKYNRQIERYAQTLKDTGLKNVSGYLWYLSSNEVEKVCEL